MLATGRYNRISLVAIPALAALMFLAWGVQTALAADPLADLIGGMGYNLGKLLGGMILGLGGLLLDMAIRMLVLDMGQWLSGGFGLGITGAWEIIRDLFNILFIFSFIYIGIKTILNSDDSGTKRALGHLIVAALFINFSLLITLTIIDFSNIAATQIYNLILSTGGVSGAYEDDVLKTGNNSITGAFMEVTSLTTFFGASASDPNLSIQGYNLLFYGMFMMFFFIITGIVFIFAAYHLIHRFVSLCIYLILSPVLFLGWVLPNFQGYTDKWLKGLLRQSFFAPGFFFLLYVALFSLVRLKEAFLEGGAGSYASIMTDGTKMEPDGFTIFIFFAVAIGFVYASVKVGDMLGIHGAKTAVNAIHAVGRGARDLAYRPIGWGVNKWGVGGIDRLNRWAESEKGTPGRRRAIAARLLMGGAAGSESLRNTAENVANYGGRDKREKAEKAVKQRATRANAVASISERLSSDDQGAKERAVRDASTPQLLEMIKDDKDAELIANNAGLLTKSQYEAINKSDDITDEFRRKLAQNRGAQVEARLIAENKNKDGTTTTLKDVVGKADTSELEAIGFEKIKEVAGRLSAKQIDDWKDLTPSEKQRLKAARKAQLEDDFGKDALGNINGSKNKALFARITNDEEISKLPDSILTHEAAAAFLNTNALSKIVDNGGISSDQRKKIRENVMNAVNLTGDAKKIQDMKDWFEKNNIGQRYPDPS